MHPIFDLAFLKQFSEIKEPTRKEGSFISYHHFLDFIEGLDKFSYAYQGACGDWEKDLDEIPLIESSLRAKGKIPEHLFEHFSQKIENKQFHKQQPPNTLYFLEKEGATLFSQKYAKAFFEPDNFLKIWQHFCYLNQETKMGSSGSDKEQVVIAPAKNLIVVDAYMMKNDYTKFEDDFSRFLFDVLPRQDAEMNIDLFTKECQNSKFRLEERKTQIEKALHELKQKTNRNCRIQLHFIPEIHNRRIYTDYVWITSEQSFANIYKKSESTCIEFKTLTKCQHYKDYKIHLRHLKQCYEATNRTSFGEARQPVLLDYC